MEATPAPMRFIVAGRAAHCNSCGAEIEDESCPNGPHAPMRFIVVGSPVGAGAASAVPSHTYCNRCGSTIDERGCACQQLT